MMLQISSFSALKTLTSVYVAITRALAGSCMALIVSIMVVQVFYRYVLGESLIWAEELCRYLLIWQTFLVLGLAFTRGEFVSLDFIPERLSPFGSWLLRVIMALPILVFLWTIAWFGYEFAGRFDQQTIPALDFIMTSVTGQELGLSIRWVYIAVPIGMVLMSLHVIADLITSIPNKPSRNQINEHGVED